MERVDKHFGSPNIYDIISPDMTDGTGLAERTVMMRKRLRTSQTDPKLDSFLRVNHAGERAAQTIYQGQLAVLKNRPEAEEIQHMMEQEVEHLETFEKLLNDYEVRPSALDPVWGAAGFLLGAGTAMLGTRRRWPVPSQWKR